MPELPEVETTLRGIEPAVLSERIERLVVRDKRLRWPVPDDIADKVQGQKVVELTRRAKYILIYLEQGSLIWHLGMSGSMRVVDVSVEVAKHDHIDLIMQNGKIIRYNDPRRFGCFLWGGAQPLDHKLLASLGPEPLDDAFSARYLHKRAQGRSVAVKNFIMAQAVVVGVGNIYASEALFLAGISPSVAAGKVSLARYVKLVEQIKGVLVRSIEQGGTTLKDFMQADGKPGYFEQQLNVYGRAGEPCLVCSADIKNTVIGQRASYFCTKCQR
ncbi:MAG: bifunctional DNA-formamidopyrimidine glycosylase/DNA-(apurinic or apyrimidinic site) lyase [Arenicellales bacterium]